MHINTNLPTTFADALGKSCGLLEEEGSTFSRNGGHEKRKQMVTFQQMSIAADYQDCLFAFHGQELSGEQLHALRIIYKSTRPWMLGHVIGILLDKLDNPRTANKDFAETVRIIVEQLSTDEDTKKSDESTKAKKGLLVKFNET